MSAIESVAIKAVELSGLDISLFILSLAVSVIIGVYFANKNSTLDEYMLGGRNQSLWPVSISMMTSFMSGLTLIGNSAELYYHGSPFSFTPIAFMASTPFTAFILLPVFHRLGNLSVFNYLEQRFSRSMQRAVSFFFIVGMILYNSLVLYVPSLSLRSVLGISETISIGAVGLSCIIYCTLGGIKAVIWTDFFQGGLMLISLLCICIGGTIQAGGLSKLLDINQAGGRLATDQLFHFDSTTRHTVFTIATGSLLNNIYMNGANQVQVQRALSLPTLRLAQWASLITQVACVILSVLASYIGLILFATYQHCDPYENHEIDKRDAILIRFVGTNLSFLPGLRGIFVAGIFAATLSTLSSFQNSMSALVIEDFIKPSSRKPMSTKLEIYLGKGLALMFGVVCVAMTFVVSRLSGLLQVAITLHGALAGPFVAAFFLGMMTRFVNTIGMTVGLVTSFAVGIYVQIHQAFYMPPLEPSLPVYIDECANNSTLVYQSQLKGVFSHNLTHIHDGLKGKEPTEFRLGEISYLWLPTLEFVVCIVISIAVSLMTGGSRQQVEDKYLIKWLHRSIPNKDDDSVLQFNHAAKEQSNLHKFEYSSCLSLPTLKNMEEFQR